MGRELAAACAKARDLYREAGEILGYDLLKVCLEGPQDLLDSTVISQPALFVTSLAALEKLRQESPDIVDRCAATAGLSLGEYTAMAFAGVIDFGTGLRVVRQRGQAMQDASDETPSGMVSILGLEVSKVEELCKQARNGEVLQVANILCPGNIAVSGTRSACQRVTELAIESGAMKAVSLSVAGAFHTPIMQSAVARLASALENATLSPPRIPVISNVDAKAHDNPETIRQLLIKQVVQPVLWEDSMRSLLDDGCDQFYEIGPGRVLRGLLRRINRKIPCENIAV